MRTSISRAASKLHIHKIFVKSDYENNRQKDKRINISTIYQNQIKESSIKALLKKQMRSL